jgi:hypothetical protein
VVATEKLSLPLLPKAVNTTQFGRIDKVKAARELVPPTVLVV